MAIISLGKEKVMYIPSAFREDDLAVLYATIRAARLSNLVTATPSSLVATPLPLILETAEGRYGTLYGHLARANPQWKTSSPGEALAIFMGLDAYVSPSWYETKHQTAEVVPTWNYVTVHAYGRVEFFHDPDRVLDVVTRLTNLYEQRRAEPWAVGDAPESYIHTMLRGIVGLRMPITRLEGKRKMSQNRNAEDRAGVAAGLAASDSAADRAVAALIPR
jgi:transcriptional regulator